MYLVHKRLPCDEYAAFQLDSVDILSSRRHPSSHLRSWRVSGLLVRICISVSAGSLDFAIEIAEKRFVF